MWIKCWLGGGEVKRDHTLRKLWIDHLHKAGKCSLEALEIFLGCNLPTPLAPPQNQGSGYAPGNPIPQEYTQTTIGMKFKIKAYYIFFGSDKTLFES